MPAEIGIGLAALGRPGYINLGHAEDLGADHSVSAMQSNAHVVLDAALAQGVRYFDVARSYGRAEEFLASWIAARGLSPDEMRVGSKWGYTYTADWAVKVPAGTQHEVKEHSLKVLQKQYGISQQHFGKHLDLYQIHSATLQSGVLSNDAVLQCLNEMRKTGLEIGLSVSGVNQSAVIEKAISIKFDGHRLFHSVQATWNLLERSAESALAKAHESGMAVIVKESLANGRLTERNDAEEFSECRKVLNDAAGQLDMRWDAIAIAAAMNQPWATTVLSGAATVEHLEANLQAREITWTEELKRQMQAIAQPAEQYWNQRSNLAWN